MIRRRLKLSDIKKSDFAQSQEHLLNLLGRLGPEVSIRTNVEHVSDSGMYRWISVRVLGIEHERAVLYNISYHVARVIKHPYAEVNGTGAVGISGVGMDMAWAIVRELSHLLYGDDRLRKESL